MMVVPPPLEKFDSLNREQTELSHKCEQAKNQLKQLMSSVILSPPELRKLYSLEQELNRFSKRLELCQEELHYMANHNPRAPEPSRW
jgi:chromosome segregation ATPase